MFIIRFALLLLLPLGDGDDYVHAIDLIFTMVIVYYHHHCYSLLWILCLFMVHYDVYVPLS